MKMHPQSSSNLFTKNPTWPKSANKMLRAAYGTPSPGRPDINSLFITVAANRLAPVTYDIGLQLSVCRPAEELRLIVVCPITGSIIDDSVYWSFTVLRRALDRSKPALPFDAFLNLVAAGDIVADMRMGVGRSGANRGKACDHGTVFRINRSALGHLPKRRSY